MELLLEAEAPIMRMSFSGSLESTLTCAAMGGQKRAIRLLLDMSATVNEMGTFLGSRARVSRTVALLLSHGVDPNLHGVESSNVCDIWYCVKALFEGGFHKICPWSSKSALLRAMDEDGREDLVALLQEYRVTVDCWDALRPP